MWEQTRKPDESSRGLPNSAAFVYRPDGDLASVKRYSVAEIANLRSLLHAVFSLSVSWVPHFNTPGSFSNIRGYKTSRVPSRGARCSPRAETAPCDSNWTTPRARSDQGLFKSCLQPHYPGHRMTPALITENAIKASDRLRQFFDSRSAALYSFVSTRILESPPKTMAVIWHPSGSFPSGQTK